MKHLLLTTIAAVVLVGCGEPQQSAPTPEPPPVEPVAEVPTPPSSPPVEAKPAEPVAASQPEPPTAKAPDLSILDAAKNGDIEAVKQHLAAGADVNAKGGWREGTPLHFAANFAANEGNKEIAELLIAKGADVNAKDEDGWTPLHWAAIDGHKEVAELLIAAGTDVNAKNNNGETPLDWAENVDEDDSPEDKAAKTANLLRKHGGKTGAELKAAGN